MAIRLANNCSNCSALSEAVVCGVHKVEVNEHYTCDSFSQNLKEFFSRKCSNCSRFAQSTCSHPTTATEEMLCTDWAPSVKN